MDEQQVIQFLNQIPLDVLQSYVAQRTQQEQAAAQQMPQMTPQQMPHDAVPQEAIPQEAPSAMMGYGGRRAGWSPDIDLYAAGGRTRTVATRGRMGARRHRY